MREDLLDFLIPSWSWYEAQVRGRDEEHHGGDGPGRHLRLCGQRDPCELMVGGVI